MKGWGQDPGLRLSTDEHTHPRTQPYGGLSINLSGGQVSPASTENLRVQDSQGVIPATELQRLLPPERERQKCP